MSIDFPSYPARTVSAGKPVDVQTLQEAFVAVLRSYGTEKGGIQTDTMLEVLRPASQADDAGSEDRNQQRHEHQQQANRNDFTQLDRKSLDQSELRQNELDTGYQNRRDQHATLRKDYQEKTEQCESQQTAARAETSAPVTPSRNAVQSNEPLPARDHVLPQQQDVPVNTAANIQNLSAGSAAPNTGAVNSVTGMPVPMSVNVPATTPVSTTPQAVLPQAFTVFTASRRFGQNQEQSDEKDSEDEKEETVEENSTKKKTPFAALHAIHTEATRPVRQKSARQLQESPVQSIPTRTAEKPRDKPKEAEPDQAHSVKTLDELLNTPAQNVSASKKGESNQPNQTQYLHRIAAACEAAAQYAPIRIKINLDQLGTLTLRFYHKADKLALRFETPSEESAKFLHEHLGGLKAILSKRNVKIASLDVLCQSSGR